jgi:arginyl-tRNA synthetase
VRKRIERLLDGALASARRAGEIAGEGVSAAGSIEVPKERQHGDLASNLALGMARAERKSPRAIAETLVRHLEDPERLVEATEIAGPGFINFRLSERFWHEELAGLLADPSLGVERSGAGRRVQVEFVSANPTGPLTVGHGRNAVLGDTIARLLEAVGCEVEREYYFNNAGRQMKVLGESVQARYLELAGRPAAFPEDGYQGDYILEIARSLFEEQGAGLVGAGIEAFRGRAEREIFADIRRTQGRLGIEFDAYFNEDTLYTTGAVDAVVAELDRRGLIARREGAVWLVGEAVGLPKDRVLVKSTGEPAYRLPDVAYHQDKLARGFDELIDVLGADHIEEHREVLAALAALGLPASRVRPVIYQFVTLTRHGEQVKMSTRKATYVTLDELIDEVGVDAARFFFLSRKSDSHLEFDLELAKKRSNDNPVYYVQYAHARISNLFGQAKLQGAELSAAPPTADSLASLRTKEEFDLIRTLATFGEVVGQASAELEPHRVVFFLQELAADLHRFYNQHRVLGDEAAARVAARLALLEAVHRVLRAGLGILGVRAPERM